jgi:transcriptional regulator with XRE-family HTH domain
MSQIKPPPADSNLDTISKRLKYLIEQAGVKQAHIARKLGVTRGTVYHILNSDDKNPKGVERIVNLLGVDPEWIHTGKGPVKHIEQKSNEEIVENQERIPVYLLDQLLMLRQNIGGNIQALNHVVPQRQYAQKLFAVQLSMPSFLQKFEAGDIVIFAEKKSVNPGDWVLAYNADEGRMIFGVVTFQESGQLIVLHNKVESPLVLKSNMESIVGVFVESTKYARF